MPNVTAGTHTDIRIATELLGWKAWEPGVDLRFGPQRYFIHPMDGTLELCQIPFLEGIGIGESPESAGTYQFSRDPDAIEALRKFLPPALAHFPRQSPVEVCAFLLSQNERAHENL